MFRKIKICIILMFVVFNAAYSQDKDAFLKFNYDLKNIGFEKFKNTVSTPFKGELYGVMKDFRLDIGNSLLLSLWGNIEEKYSVSIDREGKIRIPRVGPVKVFGMTLKEAEEKIRGALNKKYVNVQFDLSLTDVKYIRISVLGNVKNPGVYTISPFSKILDAIIIAGGPLENGSLRNIQLKRKNKLIVNMDYYEFIIKGDDSKNVSIKHDDCLYVPFRENIVAIRGDVLNPGIYEIKKDTSLSEIIDIASGIIPSIFERKIQIMRPDKAKRSMVPYKEILLDSVDKIRGTKEDIKLKYQDTIVVTSEFDFTPYSRYMMRTVVINGEINMPGIFIIKDRETLSSLIKRAGGLKEFYFFFFEPKTAYEIKECDWSSDVCSSDLLLI